MFTMAPGFSAVLAIIAAAVIFWGINDLHRREKRERKRNQRRSMK